MILMDPGWGEQDQGPSVGQLWDLLAARTSSLWSLYVMTGSDRFLQQSERKLSSAGHCDPLVTHLEPMGKLAHPSVPPGPSGLSPCSQYHWNSSPHGTGGFCNTHIYHSSSQSLCHLALFNSQMWISGSSFHLSFGLAPVPFASSGQV